MLKSRVKFEMSFRDARVSRTGKNWQIEAVVVQSKLVVGRHGSANGMGVVFVFDSVEIGRPSHHLQLCIG